MADNAQYPDHELNIKITRLESYHVLKSGKQVHERAYKAECADYPHITSVYGSTQYAAITEFMRQVYEFEMDRVADLKPGVKASQRHNF